jgi:two-component system OmpR family sensor kinase
MTTDDQARAFDQFFRGADARRMVPNGSGIGLYAARGLVEAMDGRLELDSAPGAGTTFRVILPAERADPEAGE